MTQHPGLDRRGRIALAYCERQLLPLMPALDRIKADGGFDLEWHIPTKHAAEAGITDADDVRFYGLPIRVDDSIDVPVVSSAYLV